jgi:hypothetical protein
MQNGPINIAVLPLPIFIYYESRLLTKTILFMSVTAPINLSLSLIARNLEPVISTFLPDEA